jgi:hypothetical protein
MFDINGAIVPERPNISSKRSSVRRKGRSACACGARQLTPQLATVNVGETD